MKNVNKVVCSLMVALTLGGSAVFAQSAKPMLEYTAVPMQNIQYTATPAAAPAAVPAASYTYIAPAALDATYNIAPAPAAKKKHKKKHRHHRGNHYHKKAKPAAAGIMVPANQ